MKLTTKAGLALILTGLSFAGGAYAVDSTCTYGAPNAVPVGTTWECTYSKKIGNGDTWSRTYACSYNGQTVQINDIRDSGASSMTGCTEFRWPGSRSYSCTNFGTRSDWIKVIVRCGDPL